MAITALQMITDALRLANVIDEIEAPSPEQGTDGLRSLNQMIGQWDRDGIKLGWQQVTSLAANLPIEYQDERGVKYNFAVELAGEYGIDPLPRVQKIAARTYNSLAKAHRADVESSLELLPGESANTLSGGITSGGF